MRGLLFYYHKHKCLQNTYAYYEGKREIGMAQKFMTYEQQLNKLRNDKALTIPNLDDAKRY